MKCLSLIEAMTKPACGKTARVGVLFVQLWAACCNDIYDKRNTLIAFIVQFKYFI